MPLDPAPYFATIPDEPQAHALWLKTSDGLRIRMGYWAQENAKGTVLLFPGRTEYIEKYAITAADFAAKGLATVAIDWRGQGLADRIAQNPMAGHVVRFSDYQTDVVAVLKAAAEIDLPKPWFLLGHSMGGCIGLRALMNELPVKAAAFSGPMWDIQFSAAMRQFAKLVSGLGVAIGLGEKLAPATKNETYVLEKAFEDNMLTISPQMYERLQLQARAHPELTLGGPSLLWLNEALMECDALSRLPSPNIPCITALGTNERIVSSAVIKDRMARWGNSELCMVDKGEHEVLMESAERRGPVIDAMSALFLSQT